MLKERKLLEKEFVFKDREGNIVEESGDDVVGWYYFPSYLDGLYVPIKDDQEKTNISEEEYYITEFHSEAFESDYHSYAQTYYFDGTYLAFNLNMVDTVKYFGCDLTSTLFNEKDFLEGVSEILKKYNLITRYNDDEISIEEKGYLKIVLINKKIDDKILSVVNEILEYIRKYYDMQGIHITRMFGSYILLKKVDGNLTAIKATPIPIKYCPLMIKLLKEVGGEVADSLIKTLDTNNLETQTKMMCELINEVVIKGGYFDTNRPLNSCEANVLFGASETMSSAFASGLIDAAVIVSNNLGTIITTDPFNTQGAVKRMTGLFHTSPNKNIMATAQISGIIPVFPYTASIDQLEGVKRAISLGYRRIAVSVAAGDNHLHTALAELEKEFGITIYKFGLCSTGIDEKTALNMQEHADVIWSCASKYVKELVEPNALAQVGVKIPVHIMTKQGWEIIKNHLLQMSGSHSLDDIELQKGEDKAVIVNSSDGVKVLKKRLLHNCTDCPHPCI